MQRMASNLDAVDPEDLERSYEMIRHVLVMSSGMPDGIAAASLVKNCRCSGTVHGDHMV